MNQGRIISIIALVLGAAGLTCGIIALCNMVPRENSEFDYLGLLVGILSLLVLFTVGWQIYTIIDTKSTIEEQNKALISIKDEYKKLNKKLEDKSDFIELQRQGQLSIIAKSLDNHALALTQMIPVLASFDLSNELEETKDLYSELKDEIKDSISHISNIQEVLDTWEGLSIEELNRIIKRLTKLDDLEILEWVIGLKKLYHQNINH